eukprot:c8884_g2_i1 orf=100-270(+)
MIMDTLVRAFTRNFFFPSIAYGSCLSSIMKKPLKCVPPTKQKNTSLSYEERERERE